MLKGKTCIFNSEVNCPLYFLKSITAWILRKHFLQVLTYLELLSRGHHSVLFLHICVFRARLHRLHGQDQAEDPTVTKNIFEVGLPGASVLLKLPPLHLTPGLSTGHQKHLLAAETGTDQADAEPHIQHQHQEQLQAWDCSCGEQVRRKTNSQDIKVYCRLNSWNWK